MHLVHLDPSSHAATSRISRAGLRRPTLQIRRSSNFCLILKLPSARVSRPRPMRTGQLGSCTDRNPLTECSVGSGTRFLPRWVISSLHSCRPSCLPTGDSTPSGSLWEQTACASSVPCPCPKQRRGIEIVDVNEA